jgi:glucosamine-6-phosphate deaminase
MEVIITKEAGSASNLAARRIARLVMSKPDAVLGLATGNSPLGLYKELIRIHREEGLDFSRVRTFNLDEYIGLPAAHPASYHSFMEKNFFREVNIIRGNSLLPDGLTSDVPAHCEAYEAAIREAGGIDLQILGIGSDGHIGFNEPSSSLASRTRIKTLTPTTRQDNAGFFSTPEEVPYHVITMGIGTIMESRSIALLAFGEGKAGAVRGAVEGPISASNPASVLQMHPDAKIYLDEPAAISLERVDYYKWVLENKPTWQAE